MKDRKYLWSLLSFFFILGIENVNNVIQAANYDSDSIITEFSDFGIVESCDIDEPVKFMEGEKPVKLKFVICRKQELAKSARK